MILAFSQTINDKPTYFIDKIWYGFLFRKDDIYYENTKYHTNYIEKFRDNWPYRRIGVSEKYEKIHTIRKDSANRWKAGNDIHFYINVRTKDQFQFAPVVKCVSTQKITIDYEPTACEWFGMEPVISVDDIVLKFEEIELLAKNDGFDSVEDFFAYFNTDFTGKIIHWTNLKY